MDRAKAARISLVFTVQYTSYLIRFETELDKFGLYGPDKVILWICNRAKLYPCNDLDRLHPKSHLAGKFVALNSFVVCLYLNAKC